MRQQKSDGENWEGLAKRDPLWAILSDPTKKGGLWSIEEFFKTGENEIAVLSNYLEARSIFLNYTGKALDFGCGVGRLTQALARRFNQTYGVDVSATMIDQAGQYNHYVDKCFYAVNHDTELSQFADREFSLIYSSIVLQHIKPCFALMYLQAFCRLLTPGGYLVFQVPDRFNVDYGKVMTIIYKLRGWLKIRTRVKNLSKIFRQNESEECSYEMHGISEATIRELMNENNTLVLDVQLTNSTLPNFNGNLEYLSNEPKSGWISKQYLCKKA